MAFRTYALTLTGVPQRLSDVYGDGVGVLNAVHDIPYRQVLLTATDGNSGNIYVGMDKTVSSTNFGFHIDKIPASAQNQPFVLGPFSDAGPVKLSDIWVTGTANDVITIAGIPF